MVAGAATFMITLSLDAVHGLLEIVHTKVALPTLNPLTPDNGLFGSVIVAAPDTTLHNPVPTVGVLPANVVTATLHKAWSGPDTDTVGNSRIVMIMSSVEGAQVPFVIVHLNVTLAPIVKPVTPDNGSTGSVIVAVPETTVHKPVPAVGAFPDNVAVVILHSV